jgi:23S rRNA G2069 N7-methylase RlmK/C1962 C5-methylase RlmI
MYSKFKHTSFRPPKTPNTTMMMSQGLLPFLSATLLLLLPTETSCFSFLHKQSKFRSDVAQSTRLFVKARAREAQQPSTFTPIRRPKPSSPPPQGNDGPSSDQPFKRSNSRTTAFELQKQLLKNPTKFEIVSDASKKKKSKRTRAKVESPKQTYMYAWQRRLQQQKENATAVDFDVVAPPPKQPTVSMPRPRQMGCDANPFDVPICRHEIIIDEDGARAYVLEKPPGWAILGNHYVETAAVAESETNEIDKREVEGVGDRTSPSAVGIVAAEERSEPDDEKNFDFDRYVQEHEDRILAVMTPEELAAEGLEVRPMGPEAVSGETFFEDEIDWYGSSTTESYDESSLQETLIESPMDPQTAENLRRIQARLTVQRDTSVFASQPTRRPSLISWLKGYVLETTGKTIRGGTNWKAMAGATAIDDSGLVLVAPRSLADRVFVEAASYMAVGTTPIDNTKCRIVATKRAHRHDDVVQIMEFDQFVETASTCDDVAAMCEAVRGAEDLERKAPRRLIHCHSLTVSTEFSFVEAKTESMPDDISIYASRGDSSSSQYGFSKGSFRGREALRDSNHTTAYREINGAADGFPGWTVDRYDKWLVVYHEPSLPRGPLPSIHDGFTAGVYYVEKSKTSDLVRPRLLEGKAAPERFEVLENGIKYSVSLHHDFSTGIFLDQRPQRAWLRQHCSNATRVLNTFAHTGAFGVAAAVAGASTVNVDLNRKWLDRFPLHLAANGIAFDERHDCIYGDCFDWLKKLAKRNEKYDIVILDPPSFSIGTGRTSGRRWSITSDMAELVALAAQLVHPGGYLWTTTNCASLPMAKLAKMVQTGAPRATLERIQPMPVDFPSVGPQNVKNLVWKIPR